MPSEDPSSNQIPDHISSEDPPQIDTPQATALPSNNKSSMLAPGQWIRVSAPLVTFLWHRYLTTWLSVLNGGSMKFICLSICSWTLWLISLHRTTKRPHPFGSWCPHGYVVAVQAILEKRVEWTTSSCEQGLRYLPALSYSVNAICDGWNLACWCRVAMFLQVAWKGKTTALLLLRGFDTWVSVKMWLYLDGYEGIMIKWILVMNVDLMSIWRRDKNLTYEDYKVRQWRWMTKLEWQWDDSVVAGPLWWGARRVNKETNLTSPWRPGYSRTRWGDNAYHLDVRSKDIIARGAFLSRNWPVGKIKVKLNQRIFKVAFVSIRFNEITVKVICWKWHETMGRLEVQEFSSATLISEWPFLKCEDRCVWEACPSQKLILAENKRLYILGLFPLSKVSSVPSELLRSMAVSPSSKSASRA